MSTLNIILYSSKKSQRIVYQDNDGIMTSEIEETFLRRCEVVHCNSAWARIIVSDTTRESLKFLEQKYDSETGRHIRKLYGFISKLPDGEVFFYLNEDKASVVERRTAYDCAKFQHLAFNDVFKYYCSLDSGFQYLSYGYDGIEEWNGEKDVNKRICRFCGKSFPEVTFGSDAHAVPDALGNKILFCYEECDDCNHGLVPIEDNFRKIMDFRRAMYHIPRKGTTATPTVVGKTFIVKPDRNGCAELFLMEESIPRTVNRSKPFYLHLELKESMTNEGMYKALCKMVIDLLPSSELLHFDNTIKWISSNGTFVPDSLPSVWLYSLPSDKVVYPQPVLDIFLNNKGKMPNSPYCTGILWIYDIAYLFVMPLADVDAGQYKYDADLVSHWQIMSGMIGCNNLQRQDTNNYLPSTPWVNWEVDLTQSNVHVRPMEDSIFSECRTHKIERPDVDMPHFTRDGITFNKANGIEFECFYNGKITDNDLRDVTQHIAGPRFLIDPANRQIHVQMWVEANDTTDTVKYFRYSFDAVFDVQSFWTYISIETEKDGSPKSFAFHYELRDCLYENALRNIEPLLANLRANTPFAKCSLERMADCNRVFSNSEYLVPDGTGDIYVKIMDSDIHPVCAE